MSNRKRVNISVDPDTYTRLQTLVKLYSFRNTCELIVSFAHILLDRMEDADRRRYDLPDPDGSYIDSVFDDLGSTTRQPNGEVPRRHNNRNI